MSRFAHLALALAVGLVSARPLAAAPEVALTDLVMGDKDDARGAIALGPAGEVYLPTKGAWTRTQAITTSDRIDRAGRASGVVVLADGAIYKLADNGWSALRLTQKGKAVMSSGARAVGAVGKQLFALDRSVNGEPQKLGQAPVNVLAIGASEKSIVVATDKGLFRSANAATSGIATTGAFKPLARAPRRVDRLLDDRFALIDRGVVDLDSGAVTAWPTGFRVSAATVVVTSRAALKLEGVASTAASVSATDEPDDDADAATTGKRGGKAKGKAPGKASAKTSGKATKAATKSPTKTAPKTAAAKKGSGALVIAVGTLRGAPTLVVVDGATVQMETIEVDPNAAAGGGTNGEGPNGGATNGGATSGGATNGRAGTGGGTNGRSSSQKSQQSVPVGVVADRSGRIAVAFAGGILAVREKGAWTSAAISEALPAPKPGAAPAQSGPS